MKEDRESLVFERKRFTIEQRLRMLREQGIINDGTYADLYFLTSNATTLDQLQQLAQDLTELSQGETINRPEE